MKYSDMAIYVDAHALDIYNENLTEEEKQQSSAMVYDYILHIAFMLAIRWHFFRLPSDAENFAYMFADDVYMRIITPRQFLSEDDPQYMRPIKSCLNYMNKIRGARRVEFTRTEFGEVTKPEDWETAEMLRSHTERSIENYENSMREADLRSYLDNVPETLMELLERSEYGNNPTMIHKFYNSVLISLIKNLTFTKKQAHKVGIFRTPETTTKYEDMLSHYYERNTLNAPTCYALDEKYRPFIAYYLQRLKAELSSDIQSLSDDYTLSDELMEDVIASNMDEITSKEDYE